MLLGLSAGATTTANHAASTRSANEVVLNKVDKLVSDNFWDATAVPRWKTALAEERAQILSAPDTIELGSRINHLLASLHASHTGFYSENDESFFFLRGLFDQLAHRRNTPKIDFTGMVTGGVDCQDVQVRYVLDGSPAAKAGIKSGDIIHSVDGKPYVGQRSFAQKSGKAVELSIKRPGASEPLKVTLTPLLRNDFREYLDATERSVSVSTRDGKRIGYIHVWCGGEDEHDIIEEQLGHSTLQSTDGLVFDLRDGYGGNYYDDLDMFYRPAAGYKELQMQGRKGRFPSSKMYYDKPVVCLINGGSRSGKELLAYSLKQTKRAKLVGEKTAGFVLGGRLFPINDHSALYLAVQGPQPGSLNLEGSGVEPDVTVSLPCDERGKEDTQRVEAEKLLLDEISKSRKTGLPSGPKSF